jgi:membrane-associated phospholipid phosphatase
MKAIPLALESSRLAAAAHRNTGRSAIGVHGGWRRSLWRAVALLIVAGCADRIVAPTVDATVSAKSSNAAAEPMTLTWQQVGRDLGQKYAPSPVISARSFALLSVAQYAAAMARGNSGDDDIQFSNGTPGLGRSATDRGAVAAASAAVLTYAYPAEAAAMQAKLDAQRLVEGGQPNRAFERGEALGLIAANELIERAKTDGFTSPWTGSLPTTGDRLWVSSGAPLAFPQLGQMKPFLLDSGSQFRPGPPPSATSAVYLNDVAQVAALTKVPASDPVRAQQIVTAQKWAAVANLKYWGERTSGLVKNAGFPEREAAHTFALVGAAGMDALIGCWDAKWTYFFWRPIQADPTIVRVIAQPNHPSYPSGHSCNSSASAEVLASMFPAEADALHAEVIEAGNSRVWGGIHFPFDCTTGQELGRNVAHWTLAVDASRGILNALR